MRRLPAHKRVELVGKTKDRPDMPYVLDASTSCIIFIIGGKIILLDIECALDLNQSQKDFIAVYRFKA